ILKIGATAVPVPERLGPIEVRDVLQTMACSAVVLSTTRAAQLGSAGLHIPIIVEPSVRDALTSSSGDCWQVFETSADIVNATTTVDETRDLAALMFTSGSTGRPNAVKVSHRNIIANTDAILGYLPIAE